MNKMGKSQFYNNPYDKEGIQRGTEWMEKRAIVKCKCGHIFSYAHFNTVTEWGHSIGASCEKCPHYIHNMELEFLFFDEKREWSANGYDPNPELEAFLKKIEEEN